VAWGDGPPQLEFVRGLRERGYHDLALEYLEKLQSNPAQAADLQATLPLELARSRADVAAHLPPGAEREQLLQRSRTELEGYLRTHPPSGLAREAEWALANTIADQARGLAAAARIASTQEPPPPKAKDALTHAVARFDEADRIYAQSQKKVEDEQGIRTIVPEKTPGRPLPPPPKAPPIYLNLLYQRALARYDKGRLSGIGLRESGLANDEARQLAERLSTFRAGNSLGWQGYALYARTLEGADDAKALTIYRQIEMATVNVALPAQRQVRYYQLARADASGDVTEPSPTRNQVRDQAERWLKLFGATEGMAADARHVRYVLLRILAKELEEAPENRRASADAQAKLDRCLMLIDGLDTGRAENQEALERLKYALLQRSGRAGGPIGTLRTFDEALLRTSLEFYQLQGLENKLKEVGNAPTRKGVEEQYRQQNETTLAAARKALALLTATTPERNRIRVLNILQSTLRRANDGPRAALICEYMATTARQPEVAGAAAGEALRLYQYLARSAGKPDPVASERMMAMATLLDHRYPHSPQANEARAILGRDLIVRRQYDQALTLLTKIPKTEAGYATARYYAGLAAWAKHRDLHKDQLRKMSPESTSALALLHEAIEAFAARPGKDADEQRLEVQAVALVIGIHDLFGESDQVIRSAAPLLVRIEKKQMPAGLSPGLELQVLDAVMNAYVQKKDFQQGVLKVLGVLQRRRGDPQLGDVTAFLQSTAGRLRAQLDAFQKQGPAAKAQYQATRESFRQFLEQIEKDPGLPAKQRVWLGHSYSAIGDFGRAAAVLAGVKPPPAGAPVEAVTLYHQAVPLRIVAMRQAALAKPDANDRDKLLANVEKELHAVNKEEWAKRSPTLMREEILLLEARGQYSGKTGAVARWDSFRNVLQPHFDKSDALKEMYWEATYHLAYCVYQEASVLKNPEARKKNVDRAAAIINEARRANFGAPARAGRYETLLADPRLKELKDAADRLNRAAGTTSTPTKTR